MGKVYYVNTDKNKAKDDKPFVDVICKDITYDLTDSPLYDKVHTIAADEIETLFNINKMEEEQEIQDMIDSGEISSPDEYDRSYDKPFEEYDFSEKINERTNLYMLNVADLPKDVVVQVDKVYANDENALKDIIKEMYGVSVTDIKNIGLAEKKDIVQFKTYEAITKMYESDDYRTYLNLTDNMNGYSVNNTALVIMQCPDAEAVKGFKAWNEFDRCVAKGEKGNQIWCPAKQTLKTEKSVDNYLSHHKDVYGDAGSQSYEREKSRLMDKIAKNGYAEVMNGCFPTYVFDIKQTVPLDGKEDNLEELLNTLRFKRPLQADLANCADVIDSIEKAMNVPQGTITLDPELSEQENIYKALEGYAEKVLRTEPDSIVGIKSAEPKTGDIHTMETKMSAYLVARHIGIECDDKAAYEMTGVMKDKLSYDSVHTGRRVMFTEAYDRATKFSKQFEKAFDKAFEQYQSKDANKEQTTQKEETKKEKKQVERD